MGLRQTLRRMVGKAAHAWALMPAMRVAAAKTLKRRGDK